MYVLRNEILQDTHSPSRFLLAELHLDLGRVCPEQELRLLQEVPELTLEYVESRTCKCWVDTEKNHVFLTTFAAEALWASTLAAVTLYCERYQNCQSKGGDLIQIEGDPILDPATLPILWVIDNLVHQQITEYPSNLLTPAGINSTESGIMVNEIARRSLAMMLHHEVAHIRLGHGPSEMELEKDADHDWWEWIFSEVAQDLNSANLEGEQMLKLLSVVNLLAFLIVPGVHANVVSAKSHPRPIDRLTSFLYKLELEPNHKVYAFLCAALPLHVQNSRVGSIGKNGPFDSFKDCCECYFDLISGIPTRWSEKSKNGKKRK